MSKSLLIANQKDVKLQPKITNKSLLLDNLILAFAEITVANGCGSNNCFACINDSGDTDHCCCDSR